MNRPLSRHTQGILLLALGAAAIIGGGLLELFARHLDTYETYRTPFLIVVGAVAVVVGILRLRSKTSN